MTRHTQRERREKREHDRSLDDRSDAAARNGHGESASVAGRDADGTDDGDEILRLDGVGKSYGTETALTDLSLSVAEGEILALLGPSGCGKTTLLRTLAGLEAPDSGRLWLRGVEIASSGSEGSVPPEERGVGLVFQDFALFPHLTVAENVAFGISDRNGADRDARVAELLELVDLAGQGGKRPDELSGGQKQRVALARSLAPEPDVLLLDEPLSNLDVRLRVAMREDVRRILDDAGVTAIWVTHDQEEALSVADRVGVMNEGRLHQIGAPEGVFERPATRFVAAFLGQAGFLSARVKGESLDTDIGPIDRGVLENGTTEAGGTTVADDTDSIGGTGGDDDHLAEGEGIDVLVRPDDLRVTPATEGRAHGWIVRQQYRGPSFVYRVETTAGDVLHCLHDHTESFDVGEAVGIELVAGHRLAWYPCDDDRTGTATTNADAAVTSASDALDP